MATRTRLSGLALVAALVVSCLCLITPTVADHKKPKLDAGYVQLRFYIQNRLNDTFFIIVPPLPGHGGFLGATFVADQNATSSAHPTSTLIARIKGFAALVSTEVASPRGQYVLTTAVFNEASGYAGSTLSFQAYDDQVSKVNGGSITGGTGKFRLARGWIDFSLYPQDPALGLSTLKVTAHVYYGK
eukprot:TRINITY_DN3832_c0_g1_i1.p1 TRINITY_DN3832_c0_g1~~TRINITY_DN3832_c0_g1_i1.p1  ORF type:complete len:187 (+),score=15.03 TRINITY_DN3832_c0_g1_i1:98-658(+)